MRFNCNQADLMKAINIVSRAVSSKSTLPVLKGVLIKAKDDGMVELSASDNDISINTALEAEVLEQGKTVAPAKLLSEIVRKLPQGDVFFKEESCIAEISCNYTEFKLVCMEADEFPEIKKPEDAEGAAIGLDKIMLGDMIRRVGFAASIDETRGVITGVLAEIKEGQLTMVALDGFRMAVVRKEVSTDREGRAIIHGRMMNEIGRLLLDIEGLENDLGNEGVELLLDEKKAFFIAKRTLIAARLMEGSFIKYNDIIPKDFSTNAVASADDIKESVDRASVMLRDGRNAYVIMNVKDDEMSVSSRSEEGYVHDVVRIEKTGGDIRIGFNGKFMTDVMKAVPEEEVMLGFNTPTSPCLIRPVEGEEYLYMVLPVRLPTGTA